jgi:hypothetical protein
MRKGKVVAAEAGTKITPRKAKQLAEDGLKEFWFRMQQLVGQLPGRDILILRRSGDFRSRS